MKQYLRMSGLLCISVVLFGFQSPEKQLLDQQGTVSHEDFVSSMRMVYVCAETDGVIHTLTETNQADKLAKVLELRGKVDCQLVYDITGFKPAPGTKEHEKSRGLYQ